MGSHPAAVLAAPKQERRKAAALPSAGSLTAVELEDFFILAVAEHTLKIPAPLDTSGTRKVERTISVAATLG